MLCLFKVHLKAKADARKRQLQPIDFPKAEEPKGNAIVRDMAGVGMFETKGEKRRYLEKNLVRTVSSHFFHVSLHRCVSCCSCARRRKRRRSVRRRPGGIPGSHLRNLVTTARATQLRRKPSVKTCATRTRR